MGPQQRVEEALSQLQKRVECKGSSQEVPVRTETMDAQESEHQDRRMGRRKEEVPVHENGWRENRAADVARKDAAKQNQPKISELQHVPTLQDCYTRGEVPDERNANKDRHLRPKGWHLRQLLCPLSAKSKENIKT